MQAGAQVLRQDETALTFAAFVRLLLRERRTVLQAGIAALLLATVLAFLLPVKYTATASFVPPSSSGGLNMGAAAAMMSQLSSLGGGSLLGGKSQGELYVGILKSHTIAENLVGHFGLLSVYGVKKESLAEKKLAQNSLFEAAAKSSIVTLSVTDRSPERARDLANAYLQELQSTAAGLALTESSQRRQFYEQRLAREKDELANAEVALKQSQEQTGLIAPAGQTSSEIATLAQLQAQITARQVRLASMLHDETEENPDVIRMREELSNLQAQLHQRENGEGKGGFGNFSAAQVPAIELEFIRRTRDVKYHEALFEIIAKQYEAARLDEAQDAPLQILDRASLPDTKSSPHRSIIMAAGLVLGLLGGALWVLYRSFRETLALTAA